ncbi:hypothetical protein EDB80DRAFT_706923 [Ilyonectria destructans]|nr:hypothetical protein EDB80DRAFT_706923 [Ilyonectria destructans]
MNLAHHSPGAGTNKALSIIPCPSHLSCISHLSLKYHPRPPPLSSFHLFVPPFSVQLRLANLPNVIDSAPNPQPSTARPDRSPARSPLQRIAASQKPRAEAGPQSSPPCVTPPPVAHLAWLPVPAFSLDPSVAGQLPPSSGNSPGAPQAPAGPTPTSISTSTSTLQRQSSTRPRLRRKLPPDSALSFKRLTHCRPGSVVLPRI